ncbi:hypothetical protein CIW52_12880 [Mycolicibacterium sp. P9-64]|nr:hypothetical protein CIW52_12880 [Mycolicibacterium sp. P9-64]
MVVNTDAPSASRDDDGTYVPISTEHRPAARNYEIEFRPVRTFVRVNESGPVSGHAAGSVETPLTWPVSAAASHDHVCNSEWRLPPGQLWPSGLLTVIVQRSPASCASPLHPLELVMCATHPPEGAHVELAIQVVGAPVAPLRFSAYVPLRSSAQAGPASPNEAATAITAAISPRFTIIAPFRAVASVFSGYLGSSHHDDGCARRAGSWMS